MPTKLHRHFIYIGIGVYLLALFIVSVCFRNYMLKPLWLAWGIGTVLFFFLLSYCCFNRWKNNSSKQFVRKIFWFALGIRLLYLGGIIFYYYLQTGVSFEYQAADSWNYHRLATYLADLAKEGRFKELLFVLRCSAFGFSDHGYVLYLTTLYTCFDNNILGPRILKALMSAYMCVAIYKLASRSLDEKTGRLAAVMAVFLPHFIHYTGTYLKETEMVFLATLALERADYLIRSNRYTFWNILFPILLTAMAFGFRTMIGVIIISSFLVFVIASEQQLLAKKTRITTIGALIVVFIAIMLSPIGKEIILNYKVNVGTSNAMVEKYQQMGIGYAKYAHPKYMAPGAFTLPLTNMVEVANENQKMMNGTYYVKNYLAFFALLCILVAIRDKKCRNLSLIGTYTIAYILVITLSFAFNSERYHLPAMPGILMMAAFAMTRFRKRDFALYYSYVAMLMIAIVTWNYLKLAGRGLIF